MLQPIHNFKTTIYIDLALKHIDAYDPETGAYLHRSHGHTSKATKWLLIYADSADAVGNLRDYKDYRHTFRAWTFREALDHANNKLVELSGKGKVGFRAPLWAA